MQGRAAEVLGLGVHLEVFALLLLHNILDLILNPQVHIRDFEGVFSLVV